MDIISERKVASGVRFNNKNKSIFENTIASIKVI